MEAPLKRQKIFHENDPCYGDRLGINKHNRIIEKAFEGLSSDIATVIIKSLDFKDLSISASVSKTFKKLSYHYLALKRAEIYSEVFTPENWNSRKSLQFKFQKEECKKAFRSLTPTPNLTDYFYVYAFKGLSINNFTYFLIEAYGNAKGYNYISKTLLKTLGNVKVEKSCWIAVPRFSDGIFPKLVKDENILPTLKAIIGFYAQFVKFQKPLIVPKFQETSSLTIQERFLSTKVTATTEGIKVFVSQKDPRNYPYS